MIGVAKIRLCYQVKKIYLISLLVDDNRNNEDYCINHTDLVPTCNDYLLTYFFDHDDDDDITSFYLFTVSNVILDCVSIYKLYYINKKKKVPATKVV